MADSDPDLQAVGSPDADPGLQVRRHLRAADRAALGTLQRDAGGWPYASLVLLAVDQDASPLLLISELADHTRNLREDPRASLLIDGTAGLDEPLAGSRVSLLGRLERCDEPAARDRYLRRHPSAAAYAGFGDFAVWRMRVERAHLVAGFGRIRWLAGDAVIGRPAPALASAEPAIVEHMNADHADALDLYAGTLLGLDGTGWRMTGCDPEGIDLRRGGRVARLGFGAPVSSPDEARAALVGLARQARGGGSNR